MTHSRNRAFTPYRSNKAHAIKRSTQKISNVSTILSLRTIALCPSQFAFSRDPLMLFAGALDAILELVTVVRELTEIQSGSFETLSKASRCPSI
jgi:hypothetical protein